MYPTSTFVLLLAALFSLSQSAQQKAVNPSAGGDSANITPIPMENLNPRLTEFRRTDTNNDDHISFTEFILGDRPYIEDQSRHFHQLDQNSDGYVTRKEYEGYFRSRDNDEQRQRNHADGFFKQLGTGLFPDEDNFHRHHESILFNFPAQQMPFFPSGITPPRITIVKEQRLDSSRPQQQPQKSSSSSSNVDPDSGA